MSGPMADKRAAPLARPVRPRELEDPLNHHLYHPLAWQLARVLAKTPLTPNMVSVFGGLSVVAAGIAYLTPTTGAALLGLALHMAWHVIDGADGDLARMTGRTSPRGELIDGLCDYFSHVILYTLLATVLARSTGPGLGGGWAFAIMLTAGAAHAVQSNHVEVQRRFYLHWIYGKPWLINVRPETRGMLAWLVSLYLRVAVGLSPNALAIDAAVNAASGDPARLAALRAIIRAHWTPLLTFEKWLGPNQRALALGVSMLLTASPLAYFVFGTVWLTLLLGISVVLHNRAARAIAAKL